jgi:response regulator RpfG family c-di-GMP phosphodiesterase
MEKPDYSERNLWAWSVLLAMAWIGIDAVTPLSLDVGVGYVTLVFVSLWSRRTSFTNFVGVVASCLVVLGFFLSPTGEEPLLHAATNRLLSLGVIWATALVCVLRQKKVAAEARAKRDHERALEENEELRRAKASLDEKTSELTEARDLAIYTLAKVAESRDVETGQHVERVRAYSQILAHELRKDPAYSHVIDREFLDNIYRASALHDIGKVGIRDDVLLKPGRFTPEEFDAMKRHTLIGTDILEDAITHHGGGPFMEMAAVVARCHHERFDGSGYPVGLSGTAIPLAARIVAVADVFDALTTERPYKEAYSPQAARKIIEEQRGRQFDPVIVDAFCRRFEDFVKVQIGYPSQHIRFFGVTEALLAEVCG